MPGFHPHDYHMYVFYGALRSQKQQIISLQMTYIFDMICLTITLSPFSACRSIPHWCYWSPCVFRSAWARRGQLRSVLSCFNSTCWQTSPQRSICKMTFCCCSVTLHGFNSPHSWSRGKQKQYAYSFQLMKHFSENAWNHFLFCYFQEKALRLPP